MERLARSWELAKQSLRVLRSNPSLIAFPIISSIAGTLIAVSFLVPMYFAFGAQAMSEENLPVAAYPLLFLFYVVSYFVVVFFNAGLVYCAKQTLAGHPATFGDGFNEATKHLGPILGWALISATIGMVLRSISERAGVIGRIVIGLLGMAWTVLTFFVVPAMVLENVGPVEAVKRSGSTLKKVWGEALVGTGGIGLAMFLLGMIPVPFMVGSFFVGSWMVALVVIGLSILYWLALSAVGSSLQGIYQTATYLYAQTGEVPSGFEASLITGAFESKPGMIDKFRKRF